MSQPFAVAIGECMLELSATRTGLWRIAHAGDTSNTATYLSRLGIPVAFMTAIGTDPFSLGMRNYWHTEGLDTSFVLRDPVRLPGIYAIKTDDEGERSFFYWRADSAARQLLALPGIDGLLERASATRLLYLSGITLSLFDVIGRARLLELARRVRDAGGDVAFDPNYRSRGWPDRATARQAVQTFGTSASVVLPTFKDEQELFDDADPAETAERWRRWGASEIVIKDGRNGCIVGRGAATIKVRPRGEVAAVDTTGAGDAFNAAYLAARWKGATSIEAASAGNSLACGVVQHPGAIIPQGAMPPVSDHEAAR